MTQSSSNPKPKGCLSTLFTAAGRLILGSIFTVMGTIMVMRALQILMNETRSGFPSGIGSVVIVVGALCLSLFLLISFGLLPLWRVWKSVKK